MSLFGDQTIEHTTTMTTPRILALLPIVLLVVRFDLSSCLMTWSIPSSYRLRLHKPSSPISLCSSSSSSTSSTSKETEWLYDIPNSSWTSPEWNWGYAMGTGHDCAAICRKKYSTQSSRSELVNKLIHFAVLPGEEENGNNNNSEQPNEPIPTTEEIKLILALAWQRGRWDGSDGSGEAKRLQQRQQKPTSYKSPTKENPPSVDREMLQEVLQVAIDASKKAGQIILGNAGGAEVTSNKANSRDLLTMIDPLCEKTIRETVLATFPNHDFLGEEDVPPGKEASAAAIDSKLSNCESGWLWIVDPIDGTTNFVHGMPLSMPSIAATYLGEVVVGVIYDPHRDELFTATQGGGAYMNGKPIVVGREEELGDAVVAMGSPPGEESMEMSLRGVKALMPQVRTIRMLGSAALMLAYVANSRLTAYWEYDLSSWDIAAGALLVQEAGGRFTDLDGHDFTLRTRSICASNGKIHEAILKVLREEANVPTASPKIVGGYNEVLSFMAEAVRYERDKSQAECQWQLVQDMKDRFHLLRPTREDMDMMEQLVASSRTSDQLELSRVNAALRRCSGLVLKCMGFVENGL